MIDVSKRVQVGQTVCVEEQGAGYQITVMAPGQLGHEVVAVGPDFLVLEDVAAGVKTRIPGYYLKFAAAPAEPLPQAA